MARAVTIKGIRGEFLAGIESAPRLHQNIAQVVDSDAPEETYLYGGQVPRMREWLDTRKPVDLFQKKLTVPNKIYEASIKADRFEKQDDRLGFFNGRIREMGTEAANFVDELVFGTLIDAAESATGSEGPAYDGQAFFDTDHVDPAAQYTTAQSNDLTSAAVDTTDPTLAEFKAGMKQVLESFRTVRDDEPGDHQRAHEHRQLEPDHQHGDGERQQDDRGPLCAGTHAVPGAAAGAAGDEQRHGRSRRRDRRRDVFQPVRLLGRLQPGGDRLRPVA
jgi:hypothetical protein